MSDCAACGAKLRAGVYTWTMGWALTEGSGRGRDRGRGKKAFEVRFHNTPDCIDIMASRLNDYAWERKMYSAFTLLHEEVDAETNMVEEWVNE